MQESNTYSDKGASEAVLFPEIGSINRHQIYSRARNAVFDLSPTTGRKRRKRKATEEDQSDKSSSTAASFGTSSEEGSVLLQSLKNDSKDKKEGAKDEKGREATHRKSGAPLRRKEEKEIEETAKPSGTPSISPQRQNKNAQTLPLSSHPHSSSAMKESSRKSFPLPSIPIMPEQPVDQATKDQQISSTTGLQPQEKGTEKKEPDLKSVLIVDDEKMCLSLVSRMMKKRGMKSVVAANGQEALDALQKKKPDLAFILMDCQVSTLT